MDILQTILISLSVIISLFALIVSFKKEGNTNQADFDSAAAKLRSGINSDLQAQMSQQRQELIRNSNESILTLSNVLKSSMNDSFSAQNEHMKTMQESQTAQLTLFEKRIASFQSENAQSMESIRKSVESNLQMLREDNNKKLDEMRKTVDEKLQTELQKRMRESFQEVSALMERLQKDIGSMQTLASDVGGLKRSLTNVKTRGMMGEFQLENILREILPGQYDKNVHPSPDNKAAVVEFAVRIPTEDDSFIYLPIDSKFPQDKYQAVHDAQETGDRAQVDAAMKLYTQELKRCADEIKKYIAPPFTTDYALMFLPTESMYADAVNQGMLDELWRRARVHLTGPSTVAALLSSMQLSFNNLAIKKRAAEVFTVLTEISLEFDKFAGVLQKMQTHLNQTDKDLDELINTRTRVMQRKLGGLKRIALQGEGEANELLCGDEE